MLLELLTNQLTMERRKRLPKSLRKYIRQEKARLRRQILDLSAQEKQIKEMYKRLGLYSAEKPPGDSSTGLAKK